MDTLPQDIEQFVERELATGHYQSRDELMAHALRLLQRDREEAAAGIRQGLEDMAQGKGVLLDEAFDEIRKRHSSRSDA